MSQIKSYPTPSKIRYRLERIWLRQWFRKLVLFTLVTLILLLFSLFVVISSYDFTKLKTFKQNIFDRATLECFISPNKRIFFPFISGEIKFNNK